MLGGIRWAYDSATSRVLEDFSEDDGHDAAFAGTMRYTLIRDRLDRVFSTGKYAIPPGNADQQVSLDLVHAALTKRDIETMPALAPGLVVREDLNGSPGWRWTHWRWLLAAAQYGHLDTVPWPRKSTTKQRVARQPSPDSDQPTLFEDFAAEEIGGLAEMLNAVLKLDLDTLVVGHTQDVAHNGRELVLGRARLNTGGGPAWHWRQDLLTLPPMDDGGRTPVPNPSPMPIGPDPIAVEDATVRLRPAATRRTGRASGER